MSARRQDDILRYLVDSQSKRGVTHVVELDLYDGNGACTCPHFSFRLEPFLKRGARDRRLRCRHINEALVQLAEDVIAASMKKRRKSA